jgi:hypothetical protein
MNEHLPLILDELIDWRRKLAAGELSASSVRPMWDRLVASEAALKAEFSAKKKDELARYVGYASRNDRKERMIEAAYDQLQMWFVAGGTLAYEGYGPGAQVAAIVAQLDKWTDELIQQEAAEARAKKAEKTKAISAPETLEEFRTFIRYHGCRGFLPEDLAQAKQLKGVALEKFLEERGKAKLSLEQRAKFAELMAETTKGQRLQAVAERKTVEEGSLPVGVTLSDVIPTKHTVKGHDLWVVQISARVDREVFDLLLERAKKLGGSYSSYRFNGAVPGFQFNDPTKAARFRSLERIDGAVRVDEQQAERRERNEERLTATGEKLQERGEDKLNQPRLENTARRANMAASAEAQANRTIAIGTTAVNLAPAVGTGQIKFLDRLFNAAQIEMLGRLLHRGQDERIKQLVKSGQLSDSNLDRERESQKPLTEADALHARMPWPVLSKSCLYRVIEAGRETPGAKLLAERVNKILLRSADPEMVYTSTTDQTDTLRDLARRVRHRHGSYADYTLERFAEFDRLMRMDIRNDEELQTALREYVQYRAEAAKPDPLKQAERGLIGTQIPGFFPTPAPLADALVGQAQLEPGMRVLEPEAGKADLVAAIKKAQPEVVVDLVELNSTLIGLLEKKGYALAHKGDFLDYNPGPIYDRVVMNPPFEHGQDIKHVEHAYRLLKPGGRLVAIMGEGAFFREDRMATDFRAFLENVGGQSEKNPEGAFAGADAFRQTGTATRIVVLERQAERIGLEAKPADEIEVPSTSTEETAPAIAV